MRPRSPALLAATGLAIVAVFASACRQPVEGCLDFRALTVTIDADDPCDGCCVYPAFRLNVLPARLDPAADTITEVLTRNSTYVRAPGDTVVLERLVFFLSDLMLVRDDGGEVPLLDTFGFRQNPTDPFVLQERGLVRVAPLQTPRVTTGQLLEEATFVSLRGRFGIEQELATTSPDAVRQVARYQLGQDSGLFDFAAERYRSAYLRRSSTLSGIDSVTVSVGELVDFRLDIPQGFTLQRSYNFDLAIALPVEVLIDLPAGEITAALFVAELLQNARVVGTSAAR